MKLYKKVPVTVGEKAYEIRVYYSDNLISTVAFMDNHPANAIRYQVQIPKRCDIQKVLEAEIMDEFIELATQDIIERRAERLSAILNKN